MRTHRLLLLVVNTAIAVFLTVLVGSSQTLADSAGLIVEVPGDATVRINGYLTSSTGPRRHYVSKNLEPGWKYAYTIVATVNRNGRRLVKEEKVVLHAGETIEVSLPEPYAVKVIARKIPIPAPIPPVVPDPASPPESLPLLSVPTLDALAEDRAAYFAVGMEDLKFEADVPPGVGDATAKMPLPGPSMWPCVVLDGDGEAYMDLSLSGSGKPGLVVRTAEKRDVTGLLLLPSRDKELVRLRFAMAAQSASQDARSVFYRTKLAHYRRLLNSGVSGAAWFRHQVRSCQTALHGTNVSRWNQARSTRQSSRTNLMNWFELLTGGRAISENLWLDRQLETLSNERATVSLRSLPGIRVRPFDWRRLVAGLKPRLDPLAARIPADQHALFFPSVDAALRLARQAAGPETVVLRLAQPRSERMRIQERYERQLCLALERLAVILEPELTHSLALTGSDPHVAMGTDVALLIESPQPAVLARSLLDEINSAARGPSSIETVSIETVREETGGLAYRGVRTADRRVRSYVAILDDHTVVVTNSPYQLRRLAEVHKGREPSLATEPEYIWFRDRYRLSDPKETALLVISDATIRRWGGPRWRIGQARRIWNAAVLAEVQAMLLGEVFQNPGHSDPNRAPSLPNLPDGFELGPTGAYSSLHGSLDFMTPVADLPLDFVSKAEANAYRRWRDLYQRNWYRFDPIALRMEVDTSRLAADLTVTPLTLRTDYLNVRSLTQGASIRPGAGDPHDALLQIAVAINKRSQLVQMLAEFAAMSMQRQGNNLVGEALAWFGETISVYVDDDPGWEELSEAIQDQRKKHPEDAWGLLPVAMQLPIGVQVEVTSGLQLTKFLAGLRAYLEETAPGMLKWELRTYREQPYARVCLSEMAQRDIPAVEEDFAQQLRIYYTTSGEALVISLREPVLHRAIDRQLARRSARAGAAKPVPPQYTWQGKHLGVHVERRLLRVLSDIYADEYRTTMQKIAWSNLPILNELKRRYPDKDSLRLYERLWRTRLVCPGGGTYVWSDHWQSFQSTVYGHPGQPQPGPAIPPLLEAFRSGDFGLTFEDQGLRARISLDREPAVERVPLPPSK